MTMRCLYLTLTIAWCGAHAADIGYPAGLIPNCPGATKNVSFTTRSLEKIGVVMQRVDKRNNVIRQSVPILQAPKAIAKNKFIDFKNRKTVIYFPGFFDSSLFPQTQAVANTYSKRGYNVLVSETFVFLSSFYPKSVRISIALGKKFGEFLVKLYEQGLKPENLELIGISLGAHIASHAAKYFYSLTGKKPSRLTGLDPAGPCFRNFPREMRFDKDDADKVDAIHTNIDGFGIAETIGHVDFYANGGEFQPGDIPELPCLVICSHFRSVVYWWLALENPTKFVGMKCNTIEEARHLQCYKTSELNVLGPNTNFNKTGIFYLPTNNVFPYYRGKEGLDPDSDIFTSIIKSVLYDDNIIV